MLTTGRGAYSTNFGAFSINWTGNNIAINNPFDDDPWYQNVGDAAGWLGNLSDLAQAYGSGSDLVKKSRLSNSPEDQLVKNHNINRGVNDGWTTKQLD